MGLIRILSNLSSPAELSASIASAFTATLYGVGSANLLWLPIASKLKRRSTEEAELSALVSDGVASIQAGDNPRIVREKLAGYLAPTKGKGKKETAAAGAVEATAVPAKAGA